MERQKDFGIHFFSPWKKWALMLISRLTSSFPQLRTLKREKVQMAVNRSVYQHHREKDFFSGMGGCVPLSIKWLEHQYLCRFLQKGNRLMDRGGNEH
jgi:hypothetical protein